MKAYITITAMPGICPRFLASLPEVVPGQVFKEIMGACNIILEVKIDSQGIEYDKVIEQLRSILDKIHLPEVYVATSYLVVREARKEEKDEGITAYIFLNVLPEDFKNIQDQLVQLHGIVSVDAVLGNYDIIAKTNIPINELPDFLDRVHHIPGIRRSTAHFVADQLRRATSARY